LLLDYIISDEQAAKRIKLSLQQVPAQLSFNKRVRDCSRLELGDTACANPIGLDPVIEEAMATIASFICKSTSPTDRVPPLVFSRLARGGKTTTLCYLFDELKKRLTNGDFYYTPIMISFNGSSNFRLRDGETQKAAILRLIALQLIDIGHHNPLDIECDEAELNKYLSNNEEKVVLLIDELNALGCPLDVDAGLMLRQLFLDKKDRYLVFTTHVPMIVDSQLSSVLGTNLPISDRGCCVVSLPTCMTERVLQSMSPACSGLTRAEVAYYGGMPSLIYSVKHLNEHLENRFGRQKISIGIDERPRLLAQFLEEMFTGTYLHNDVRRFDMFSTSVSETHLRWPPCYIGCILEHINNPESIHAATMINSYTVHAMAVQSGMDWEITVQIAIFLKCLLHKYTGSEIPFFGRTEEKISVQHILLPGDITTLDNLHEYVDRPTEQGSRVVFYTFAFARFPTIDGLLALTINNKTTYKGVQMKAGNNYPTGSPPEWIDMIYLIRGTGPNSSYIKNTGWYYMSADEVKLLLGYSLNCLYPDIE
jgi:hypothetical protein